MRQTDLFIQSYFGARRPPCYSTDKSGIFWRMCERCNIFLKRVGRFTHHGAHFHCSTSGHTIVHIGCRLTLTVLISLHSVHRPFNDAGRRHLPCSSRAQYPISSELH
ncbi:hypothetical protein BDR05DRAFT_169759 [Suillus weaverae]|nr:hypothetical protein BDR05DRAFT_169759 [Suillus weaverae]